MKTTNWSAYCQALADGRFKISSPALVSLTHNFPDRILDTFMAGWPARILLLDKPLKIESKNADSLIDEHILRRIRLNELPGWPPKLASTAHVNEMPGFLECSLRKAKYLPGPSTDQGGLLYSLEHRSRRYQAWHVDCPAQLLWCVEATLNQEGAVGRKLLELQDIRLMASE